MLIKEISQEEVVFRALGFYPIIRRKFTNPLRKDRRPGAYFAYKNGRLRLYDHGDSYFHRMDCWDIYQHVFSLSSVSDALKHFHGNGVIAESQLPRYDPEQIEFKLQYAPIDWDEDGLAYWDDYGISHKDLVIDNICQVGSYSYINKEGLRIQVIPNDVCFALPNSGKVKIYRPTTLDRSRKWMSDYTEDLFWYLRSGEDVAPVGFIGSSYKDIRVIFNSVEVDAYAPGVSETALATQIAAWPIITRLREHDVVLIGMDFDRAGIEAATNWSQALSFHKINHIILPFEELNADSRVLKDYADVKKFSPTYFKQIQKFINKLVINEERFN